MSEFVIYYDEKQAMNVVKYDDHEWKFSKHTPYKDIIDLLPSLIECAQRAKETREANSGKDNL